MSVDDNYLLMCENTKEIQDLWKPEKGDLCKHPQGNWGDTVSIISFVSADSRIDVLRHTMGETKNDGTILVNVERFDKKDCVWIPRQNQLQEMLGIDNHLELESQFADFVYTIFIEDSNEIKYSEFDKTMEEMWLLFIMEKKFNQKCNYKSDE